jgi:preprotein translocase subunit SecA
VINRQRQRIYTKRDEMLAQEERDEDALVENMTPAMVEVKSFIPEVVDSLLLQYQALDADEETILANIQQEFGIQLPVYAAVK